MTEEKTAAGKKPGLYANIHSKQKRISKGSGEKMRKAGEKGAPAKTAFRQAKKTAGKRRAEKAE